MTGAAPPTSRQLNGRGVAALCQNAPNPLIAKKAERRDSHHQANRKPDALVGERKVNRLVSKAQSEEQKDNGNKGGHEEGNHPARQPHQDHLKPAKVGHWEAEQRSGTVRSFDMVARVHLR